MNPHAPARGFVAAFFVALALGFGLASRAAAQIQYSTVALSGQAAPGTPAGVNYSFFTAPVLNDAGQAAYGALLIGSGVTPENANALFAGPLAAPQLVARSNDAAPDTPAGVNYSSFDFPTLSLNDAGQVAYVAFLTGSGVTNDNARALYAGPLADPQVVAREGDAAPGTPAGVNYASFGFGAPALNDVGQVTYNATLTGSGVIPFENSEVLYAGPLAAPQPLAREGDAAPGTPAGVSYSGFFSTTAALNDAGQAAYVAFLTGSGVTPANGGALYAGPLAAPQLVARTGDAAPGTPAGVNYSDLSAPTLNDAGHVAYSVILSGSGVTSENARAIYAGPLAAPQLVARSGDAAPGTPAGVNYSTFNAPDLNDAGQVAYLAILTGSSGGPALYAGPLAAPQLLARVGDAAPGTPAGVNYSAFFTGPVLNDAGQAAYVAFLTGGSVTSANDIGLFVSDPVRGGLLIAREGDLFDVGGGDLRTIADNGFNLGFGGDLPGGLSNDGTLAFSLVFTDGTSGVFSATIVPEAGALALLASAGLTVVGCRLAIGSRPSARK